MDTSKRSAKDRYYILLHDYGYNGKPDKLLTNKRYALNDICAAGDKLKEEYGYKTYKVQKVEPKKRVK